MKTHVGVDSRARGAQDGELYAFLRSVLSAAALIVHHVWRVVWTVSLLLAPDILLGQEFGITRIGFDQELRVRIEFESSPDFYYVLYQGQDPASLVLPVNIAPGVSGTGTLVTPKLFSDGAPSFYQLRRILRSAPADTDGDGVDDIFELTHPGAFDALNGGDALLDFDRDGVSNLQEYRSGSDPVSGNPLTTLVSSPLSGDSGVSVTRETIVRFSNPLAAGETISANEFFATFGSRKILSRVELAQDRKSAALFYLEPLPGSARVRVQFDGTSVLDRFSQPVDADGDGVPGGIAVIDFDTSSQTVVSNTVVSGRVFASELAPRVNGAGQSISVNVPLAGVIITVDGMEESLRTITDAVGNFRLENAPSGQFFVHIDGRTVRDDIRGIRYPDLAYYPFVAKRWESVPGKEVNIGEVYLPLVSSGTLQAVSALAETIVTFPSEVLNNHPELDGVSVTVPANALFSDDGVRGGRVGIAPVPPDRLPEPLPNGLNFPLVITIQTDGPSNFDQPVPVRFPNLPDPATGIALEPGAKSALWSFNHDLGTWQIQGAMTVTDDGLFVVTDPGVGVLQPGWHGTQPGCVMHGRPPVLIGPRLPPKCPSVTGEQVATAAYKLGKDIFGCAAGLLEVRNGIKCAVTLVTLVPDLALTAQEMQTKLNTKPAPTSEALIATFQTLKFLKDRAVALKTCFETASPVNKAQNISACIGAGLTGLQTVCEFTANTAVPVECQPGWVADYACRTVDAAKDLQGQADKYITFAKDLQEQFALTAICRTVDGIELLIQAHLANRGNSLRVAQAGSVRLTADQLAELNAQLDLLVAQVQDFVTAGAPVNNFTSLFDNLDTIIERQSQLEAQIAAMQSTPVPGTFYYVLAVNGQIFRGRTSGQGTLERLLAPNSELFFAEYEPSKNLYGEALGFTLPNGGSGDLPAIALGEAGVLPDTDSDGLADAAEFVIGTDTSKTDTDGDGVNDGAEVRQGTNPLDGLQTTTGIIASADTAGTAADVTALNDLVFVADGSQGVTVFNVFGGMNPVAVAQVDTPGNAVAVASEGRLAVAADGAAGLSVIDINDPPAAFVVRQIATSAAAQAVEAAAGVAYAGLTDGRVLAVDLLSGAVLDQLALPLAVQDLRLDGDYLYVLTSGALHIVSLEDGRLSMLNSVASPGGVNTANGRMRLFVGGGIAYSVHRKGYNTIDVSDPLNPRLITATDTTQFGWKQIVLNGSGLGVAAVSPNQSFDGPHDISLYDVRDPAKTSEFIAQFPTPGVARAVSIFNGIAYIADHTAGLQVVNYLPFDTLRKPPAITLTASFPMNPPRDEEGKLARVTAHVTDDVQVRNVEFHIDGQRVATDGNFPFEYRFITPLLARQSSFRVRAKATDTGGNSTWTDEISVTLAQDATPPRVTGHTPRQGARLGNVHVVTAFFNEAIDPATLNANSFTLTEAGADGQPGTADDIRVTGGSLQIREDGLQAFLNLPSGLPFGAFRATIENSIADRAGNRLAQPFSFGFEVREITIVAKQGTPADPFQSSANAGQVITIQMAGLTEGARVTFPTRSSNGTVSERAVNVVNVANGTGEATVPNDATTGMMRLPDGSELFVQIVPTITRIDGGRGRFTAIYGSGFMEGKTTIQFGSASIADGGTSSNDGIDVRPWDFENNRIDVTPPEEARLPWIVVTEGGSSGRSADVTGLDSVSEAGTPALAAEASANVGQAVTLTGSGYSTNSIVALESMSDFGAPFIRAVAPDSVSADGTSLVFTVPPDARTGVVTIMGGGSGKLLQIVPRVTRIDGGRGRFTAVYGSGFIEGNITVRFGVGDVQLVDGGVNSNDGIDVRNWDVPNHRLDITPPANAALPWVVVTEGGSSGRITDVREVLSSAQTGTPAVPGEASANVGQTVTLRGAGYRTNSLVVLEAMNSVGTPFITTVAPASVADDGASLVFTVPPEARTGVVTLLNGGSGKLLQIVPRVMQIDGGRGRFTAIYGSGFTEGNIKMRFGEVEVVDAGVDSSDGIDVRDWTFANNRLDVTPPDNAALPWIVITEGGASGREADVTEVLSAAETGAPAKADEASANVGQTVTLKGAGYATNSMVVLEAMNSIGTPFITTIAPDSVAQDGTSLIFTVPDEARTGVATLLSGGSGRLLQIVPRITRIDGGLGQFTAIYGTGFTEGFSTLRFAEGEVVDGGIGSSDGIDVRDWSRKNERIDVTLPANAGLPWTIVTEGGASGRANDVTSLTAAAEMGVPANSNQASANVGQSVTMAGSGFNAATRVVLEAMNSIGQPFVITVTPSAVSPDGSSLTFSVPPDARTGSASLLSGGSGRPLQIVPVITSVGTINPGSFFSLYGSGLIEGAVTVSFGGVTVTDGGPGSNDGIDVRSWSFENNRLDTTVPAGGIAPVTVTTAGGTSNALSP